MHQDEIAEHQPGECSRAVRYYQSFVQYRNPFAATHQMGTADRRDNRGRSSRTIDSTIHAKSLEPGVGECPTAEADLSRAIAGK